MTDGIRIAIDLVASVARLYETVEFWRPVVGIPGISALPEWLAPTLALGALLALLLLSGVAIGSLVSLVTALLFAALILDEIFGVVVELPQ